MTVKKVKPSKMVFEQYCSDNNDVEFSVSLDCVYIGFEGIGAARFPVEELDWLIGCLEKIRGEINEQ